MLRFYHDSEVLRSKQQIFHNSIVSQFPEETRIQRKSNQIEKNNQKASYVMLES